MATPAQQPVDAETAGTGFILENESACARFELARQPRHRRELPADRPVVAHFAPGLIARGHIDRILVHIHSDKQLARLTHGLPPLLG